MQSADAVAMLSGEIAGQRAARRGSATVTTVKSLIPNTGKEMAGDDDAPTNI